MQSGENLDPRRRRLENIGKKCIVSTYVAINFIRYCCNSQIKDSDLRGACSKQEK